MIISRVGGPLDIQVDNIKLKQVQEFKYLGSIFTSDGKLDREIDTRCQKANAVSYQLSPLLKHQNINMAVKRQMIKSIFQPVLCYQCQTWPISKRQERKITTCEMRCLRKTIKVTRRDKMRNEDIRTIVGTTPCIQHIQQQQLKWFGHLVRMEVDQLPSRAYNSRHSGFRARGRPRVRWIDNVTDTLRRHGMTTTSATHLAQDRILILPMTLHGKRG